MESEIAVIWTEKAQEQLGEIYNYIAEESSIAQADKVFDKIMATTAKLSSQPHKFPPDKFKGENTGDYRAFEIFHCRVSYKVSSDVVHIIRVRSTHQNPDTY